MGAAPFFHPLTFRAKPNKESRVHNSQSFGSLKSKFSLNLLVINYTVYYNNSYVINTTTRYPSTTLTLLLYLYYTPFSYTYYTPLPTLLPYYYTIIIYTTYTFFGYLYSLPFSYYYITIILL